MKFGAHMSISGGHHQAIARGLEIDCDAIQIFTKNNNQWRAKPLTEKDIESFKKAWRESTIDPVVAHNGYLINLCSANEENLKKSIASMKDELDRAEALGLPYLVIHPGSHGGKGEKEGVKEIADNLSRLHGETKGYKVKLCLETTAGQGTGIGYRFEHLAEIIDRTEEGDRLGICLDTCHVFAAGYDIRSPKALQKTLKEFDEVVGLDRLHFLHINDSKKGLGSRVDRHEHIGRGAIGLDGFKAIVRSRALKGLPMILETPKGKEMEEDRMNLKTLRELAGD